MNILLACIISASTLANDFRPLDQAFVEPHAEFNGPDRPLLVEITSPRTFGSMGLALMDAQGQLLARVVQVDAGEVNLIALFPNLWNQRQTCYVQLIKRDEAQGSAMVLVPMLSRMVPITEQERHPTYGTMHTKIVGWRDEFAPPPPPPPDTTQDATRDSRPAGETSEDEGVSQADAINHERFFSGFRAYVDRDVMVHTTLGDIRLAMSPEHAPNTVKNFLDLCDGGFYRDMIFHRIVPLTSAGDPFVIQAGDPTGSGEGGPGYWLPIESSTLPHDFGVISMARDDNPDTGGSQFFICLSREGTARLDQQYCSFGYAVSGADTILAIANVELADLSTGRPLNPPIIQSATLVPAPPYSPGTGRPDQRVVRPLSQTTRTGRIPR
ncbi:MAG: peptidylprolyl isomerase [Planctomycetota bacterium]|nr:peptidylprolyl isomerase [Planctomycetota bacterium]